MSKGDTALFFKDGNNIGSIISWLHIICKSTGLDHPLDFYVVLNSKRNLTVRLFLKYSFNVDISQPMQLSN